MGRVVRNCWLAITLSLTLTLTLWNLVAAAGPPHDDPDQDDSQRVALVSTEARCLAVQGGVPDSPSATVRLQWDGRIEEAFLVLAAAGSQGGHSIYVNGQRVGSAPVRPGDAPCRTDSSVEILGPSDVIPIPTEVLAKGENVITLTNDANVDDGWTAASVYIEIHGVLSGPPVAALEVAQPARPHLGVDATAPIAGSILLTSTYELAQGRVISQLVSYQVPANYTGGVSTPLLIGIHGMGGSGQGTRDFLAAEANSRGWLLAAPEMHGRYYINHGGNALAWLGAQHDIIDTIEYMMSGYQVDPSRIYIAGGSMGGQTAAMMAAKYPDVFAAAAAWKPFTDLTDWYYELDALNDPHDLLTKIGNETGGTPVTVAFEYERRSPMEMPRNSRLIPIKMWHDEDDNLVFIHHSRDLRDAVNSWNPPTPVVLIEIAHDENECPSDPVDDHCYTPDPVEVFDHLEGFTLSSQPPLSLTVRTDESKPYYWLNFAQTGDDHWSQVQASYDLSDTTVTATTSDAHPLTVAFNLGTAPTVGRIIQRPGMGLPATTYLVSGGGNYELADYASGYLTTTLTGAGQFTLTISAIQARVTAVPSTVVVSEASTSTIAVVVEDYVNNPAPDGTPVEFSTTAGTFPDGNSVYTATTTGGQATAILSLGTTAADLAEITARVESVIGSTSVAVVQEKIYLPIVIR